MTDRLQSHLRQLRAVGDRLDTLASDWSESADWVNTPRARSAFYDAGHAIIHSDALVNLHDRVRQAIKDGEGCPDAQSRPQVFVAAMKAYAYTNEALIPLDPMAPQRIAAIRADTPDRDALVVEAAQREIREYAEGCRIIADAIEADEAKPADSAALGKSVKLSGSECAEVFALSGTRHVRARVEAIGGESLSGQNERGYRVPVDKLTGEERQRVRKIIDNRT